MSRQCAQTSSLSIHYVSRECSRRLADQSANAGPKPWPTTSCQVTVAASHGAVECSSTRSSNAPNRTAAMTKPGTWFSASPGRCPRTDSLEVTVAVGEMGCTNSRPVCLARSCSNRIGPVAESSPVRAASPRNAERHTWGGGGLKIATP